MEIIQENVMEAMVQSNRRWDAVAKFIVTVIAMKEADK